MSMICLVSGTIRVSRTLARRFPLVFGACIFLLLTTWRSGRAQLTRQLNNDSIALEPFVKMLQSDNVTRVDHTAVFLNPRPDQVPNALLHNLKHNRVLHDQNIILKIETTRTPRVKLTDRATYSVLNPHFGSLTLRFGFMETPNVSLAMAQARRAGLKFDVMKSSFFLSRKRAAVSGEIGAKRLLDRIYAQLSRIAADPTDFYSLPRERVVELGERLAI